MATKLAGRWLQPSPTAGAYPNAQKKTNPVLRKQNAYNRAADTFERARNRAMRRIRTKPSPAGVANPTAQKALTSQRAQRYDNYAINNASLRQRKATDTMQRKANVAQKTMNPANTQRNNSILRRQRTLDRYKNAMRRLGR